MSALRDLARRSGPSALAGVRRQAHRLGRRRPARWLVRGGFAARAITYGVIGVLAIALALGAGTDGTSPNQEGALALIARSPLGRIALIIIGAGLLAYALWKLTQALVGHGPEGGGSMSLKDRVGNAAGGLVYVGFFAVAIRALIGSGGDSSAEPRQATRGVLAWPGGQVIVALAGAGLIVISLYQLYDALRGGFTGESKTERMTSDEKRVFVLLGRIGLSARALVFTLIGYFLLRTAIESNPRQAIGIDGALARLHHQPLGAVLVAVVGAGLLIFAAFSLFEGRYRRL